MNQPLSMADVIIPKSDQWNADDFVAGPITFTIRDVHIRGGQEQPVNILLDGSDKAYRPCKSMSRVLVAVWGPDAKQYVGRSLTLYRDPSVKWAGMEVGGIRISHMTHMERPMTMALTATKGSRKPYTVQPLVAEVKPIAKRQTAEEWAAEHLAAINAAPDEDALDAVIAKALRAVNKLKTERPELFDQIAAAETERRASFDPAEGKPTEDTGEGFTDDDTPYAATVAQITAMIDKALGEASFEAAKAEYTKHMMALPKDVCAPIEAALQAKKVELGL